MSDALFPDGDVLAVKARIVRSRQAVAEVKLRIAHLEAALTRLDPQMVVSCRVPGYMDPPERLARATADRAAGIKSITVADADKIARGEMEPPASGVVRHQIYDLKLQLAHHLAFVTGSEAQNFALDINLDQLDPQRVCAAHVADYQDPPYRVAKAAAESAKNGA